MQDENKSKDEKQAKDTQKEPLYKRFWQKCKGLLVALLNPRFLLCFGIAWMITNGWAYVLLGIGAFYEINWMLAVGGAYLAFLWMPFSPEKIITIPIAIFFLRWLFPKDEKTLLLIRRIGSDAKRKVRDVKKRHRERVKEGKRAETKEKQEEKEE